MKFNVVAPSVGESITEVSILKWAKQSGQAVKNGEMLLEIESDKATVEIVAEHDGVLTITKKEGERIPVGEVIGVIDDAAKATSMASAAATAAPKTATAQPTPTAARPAAQAAPAQAASAPASGAPLSGPAARKNAADRGVNIAAVAGTGKDGRVTKGDVLAAQAGGTPAPQAQASAPAPSAKPAPSPLANLPMQLREGDRRVPMSMLRSRIAERLVAAQHTAAILTTFNEVDMTAVMELRAKNKDAFKAKNGVSLGFMSFFTRACVEALKTLPEVNASIDGTDIIHHDYIDMGIAVGTERGLVVPVVRGAQKMGVAEIEKKIAELANKAKDSKLSLADLSGGTFTISNGGVYGSLLSTPILNPPQSAILGMHKIQERPIAVDGKVVVKPMMYLALSYDHRIIDGKGAVTFLVTVKDLLENPSKLKLEF
jgi:2-oxoglutarate dehydrogenase E2 component (dihydrolipoamide succinyltransferase)